MHDTYITNTGFGNSYYRQYVCGRSLKSYTQEISIRSVVSNNDDALHHDLLWSLLLLHNKITAWDVINVKLYFFVAVKQLHWIFW